MAIITALTVQRGRDNRISVFLDGAFALGCNKRVAERARLKVGMELTEEAVRQLQAGERQQRCFDKAMEYLARRMHSRAELQRKLLKAEFAPEAIEATLARLTELRYLDDAEFARQKLAQAQRKLIGQRRAMQELMKSGVKGETARSAVREHFDRDEARENAQHLIEKTLPRLLRLEPLVAKRRLVGLLMRRGFEYDAIKPLVEKALGNQEETPAE